MLLILAVALLPACHFTIRAAPTCTCEQAGIVQLSASGTANQPRWLRWSNDDEAVHPALVPATQTAAISQFDLTGSHRIIDGLVVRDAIYQPRVMGSRNSLRRMVFEKPRAWEGMAIVAKGPADKPESYIEHNLVWGFRKTDPLCAGPGTPGVVFDFGSQAGSPPRPMLARDFTVRNNVLIGWVPHAIYLGRKVEDLKISGNYVANADLAISNSYGRRITIRDNVFVGNGTDYQTGPDARETDYAGNRRAGLAEKCLTLRHITASRTLCNAV